MVVLSLRGFQIRRSVIIVAGKREKNHVLYTARLSIQSLLFYRRKTQESFDRAQSGFGKEIYLVKIWNVLLAFDLLDGHTPLPPVLPSIHQFHNESNQ